MGLVLLAALQRRRRGIHISSMLRPDEVPLNLTLAELRAARNTSMDDTMNRLEVRAGAGMRRHLGFTILVKSVSVHGVSDAQ